MGRKGASYAEEDDDLPPPLEDMSEEIARKKEMKKAFAEINEPSPSSTSMRKGVQVEGGGSTPFTSSVLPSTSATTSTAASSSTSSSTSKPKIEVVSGEEKKKAAKKSSSGSGMKKGFLLGGGGGGGKKKAKAKVERKEEKKEEEEIIEVIPRPDLAGSDDDFFKKVEKDVKAEQDSASSPAEDMMKKAQMFRQSFVTDTSWQTPAFFQKLSSDPELAQALQDPRFMQIINEVMSSPKKAEEYAKNEKFMRVFQKFSSIMAEHYEKLAESSGDQKLDKLKGMVDTGDASWFTPEVMAKIEADAELREGLKSKKVQDALKNSTGDVSASQRNDPELKRFFQKLWKVIQSDI